MLSGECIADHRRARAKLKAWDFLHCPGHRAHLCRRRRGAVRDLHDRRARNPAARCTRATRPPCATAPGPRPTRRTRRRRTRRSPRGAPANLKGPGPFRYARTFVQRSSSEPGGRPINGSLHKGKPGASRGRKARGLAASREIARPPGLCSVEAQGVCPCSAASSSPSPPPPRWLRQLPPPPRRHRSVPTRPASPRRRSRKSRPRHLPVQLVLSPHLTARRRRAGSPRPGFARPARAAAHALGSRPCTGRSRRSGPRT